MNLLHQISVVIPAKNEARILRSTLAAISNALKPFPDFELIVVDNGSTDATGEIARLAGAQVLTCPNLSVGACRNAGVGVASGEYILFLDADVHPDEHWTDALLTAMCKLEDCSVAAVGGKLSAPVGSGWVARAWYPPTSKASGMSHIGSGLMMVSRTGFLQLGGFDESLSTGEDWDYCRRATSIGKHLVRIETLRATHRGSPESIHDFWRRERWHGQKSLERVQLGTIEIASGMFLIAHLALAVALLNVLMTTAIFLGAAILAMCVAAAVRRVGLRVGSVRLLQASSLFYVYFWARLVSLCQTYFGGRAERGEGAGRRVK